MTQAGTVEQRQYGIRRATGLGYDEAVAAVKAALKEQGFGVLTEIDVKATLKEKLDEDVRPYVIIGACNPPLAHRALTAQPEIGLMLPCNVVVRDSGEGVLVEAMDPEAVMGIVDDATLHEVAAEARKRLAAALAALP